MKLRKAIETYSLWAFLVVLILALAVWTDFAFVRLENAANIMSQMSVEMIIALGMTMVIITAGIDLSVGSPVALTGVLGTMALTHLLQLGGVLKNWVVGNEGLTETGADFSAKCSAME